jgi:hypothetical protein
MSGPPRYLVAKYISDLQRMEPRNIGVVVWTSGSVAARFAAERPGGTGDIDGRSVPAFVTSTAAYKQWVDFWRDLFRASPGAGGKVRNRWAEILKATSRGNFWLAEGGVVLDRKVDDTQLLADGLFARLVEPGLSDDGRDIALDRVADDIIRKLRLARNTNFHTKYRVACSVAPNVEEDFEFSHAYKNGSLRRLYQRVPLCAKRTPLRRTVHDSAWMFEKVVQQRIVARDQAIALVYVSEEQKKDPAVSWSFDVLSSVARLANLADPNEALAAFVVD